MATCAARLRTSNKRPSLEVGVADVRAGQARTRRAVGTDKGRPRLPPVVSESELAVRTRGVGPAAPATVSDGELIQRAGAGDRSAFETLYRRYARSVFGLALRRLGDRGRAEDAVQETFVSVWRAAKSYRADRGSGGPWLYAVARNAISDRGRARTETPAETPDEPAS